MYPRAAWFQDDKPEKTYDIHRAIKETISPRRAKPDETYAQIEDVFVFRLLLLEKRSQAGVSATYRLARKVSRDALSAASAHSELRELVRKYADDLTVQVTLLLSDSSLDNSAATGTGLATLPLLSGIAA
jgi:hypothetical protein